MVDMAFFRGGLGRWLPPSVPPVDEAVLLRRCWELLVCLLYTSPEPTRPY